MPKNALQIPSRHTLPYHCRLRLVSLEAMSGLPRRFTSGRTLYIPSEGSIGPGLEYPPPPMDMDIEYAGVLLGLTPVVISATLGKKCPPLPIGIGICIPLPPIPANARPSLGLAGGTDLGVLSLLAAIVREDDWPRMWLLLLALL